jgi:hypothetical protein
MIVLFVGFADFGRIFATSVLLEAAVRDAAEIGANEYLASPPGPLDAAAPAGDPSYYNPLHDKVANAACTELAELPNATAGCSSMPLMVVCVHDSHDTSCAGETHGATIPAECNELPGATSNQNGGAERWVEVRLCYRFTSLVDVPLISFGTFWLQRTRTFVIPCYFKLGTQQCGV